MPAVTRIGDPDMVHCSIPYRDEGNEVKVYCNGVLISCQGDKNTVHDLPGSPCPSHSAPIAVGSTTVKINNDGVGRVGDAITGCTNVAGGSPNVFAGPPGTQQI